MQDEGDYGYNPSYSQLDTLGFNLWHSYNIGIYSNAARRWYPEMRWLHDVFNDTLFAPVSSYSVGMQTIISNI